MNTVTAQQQWTSISFILSLSHDLTASANSSTPSAPPVLNADVDVERKQAQAIASLPDSIAHYYAYSNEDFTAISLRLPVP